MKTKYSKIKKIKHQELTLSTVFSLFTHLSEISSIQKIIFQRLLSMVGSLAFETFQNQSMQKIRRVPHVTIINHDQNEEEESVKFFSSEENDNNNTTYQKRFQNQMKKINNQNKLQQEPLIKQLKLKEDRKQIEVINLFIPKKASQEPQPPQQSKLYKEKIRNKTQRSTLEGHFCTECKTFTNALGLNEEELKNWTSKCSKHRGNNQQLFQDLKLFPTPENSQKQ